MEDGSIDTFSSERKLRILLVDDEEMIRTITYDMLTFLGYDVYVAENGIEALELYESRKGQIDLVLIDLIMPKMNGVACYQKLRELNPDIPVVITSGVGEVDKRESLLRMGVNGYLEKPYTIKILADTISSITK